MFLDFENLSKKDMYKMLTSTVVPRPIAFVTTKSRDGIVNAAPFSFFNAMSSVPPIMAVGVGRIDRTTPKNTAANILDTKEFVINLVSEAIAPQMNECAVDMPAEMDELAEVGLTAEPSEKVAPPRIAESPVAYECRLHTPVDVGDSSWIMLGAIVGLRIHDAFIDADKLYVLAEKMNVVGRMHGRGWYARLTDRFEMPRMSMEQWRDKRGRGG
jgi:flavin reductase (DIM6/NTAB) family NADH-FMN oxidoreductase RutF